MCVSALCRTDENEKMILKTSQRVVSQVHTFVRRASYICVCSVRSFHFASYIIYRYIYARIEHIIYTLYYYQILYIQCLNSIDLSTYTIYIHTILNILGFSTSVCIFIYIFVGRLFRLFRVSSYIYTTTTTTIT